MGEILDYRTLRRADGARLNAGHSEKDPSHTWGPAGRDLGMHGLLLVVDGAGHYRDAQRRVPVSAGDCLVLFPGVGHDYGPGPGQRWQEAFLDLRLPFMELLEREGVLRRDAPVWRLDRDRREALHRLIRDIVAGRIDDLARIQLRLHDVLLHAAPLPAADPDEGALQRARALLESEPARRVTPQAAARAAGMGWESFRRRFRRRFGLAPAQWRLHHRIERAVPLLLEPGATIASVAAASGFCDVFHFSRRFSAVMGRSPSRFRRDHGVSR